MLNGKTTEERPTILGEEIPCNWATIPTEVYAKVLDAETKEPTGFIKRIRYRTRLEVFGDLYKALDLWVCPKCEAERPVDHESCAWQADCAGCGERMESLIDEYFNCSVSRSTGNEPCGPFVEIIVNANSGGSEGHHVTIGALVRQDDDRFGNKPLVYQHWFHYKTLQEGEAGMDRAFAFARRCAKLLGL